ncbi:MAG TPA: TolC family protein, partial [Bacteroides sp.]|nr:TolC family protein [Bacteroides sp.]
MNRKKSIMARKFPSKLRWLIRTNLFVSFIACFFIVSDAAAQEVYDLSRCIQMALERNFDLQVVRNREDVAINNYTAGNAGMLPAITTTNRLGGTVNSSVQDYGDGGTVSSSGVHNTSGSSAVSLGMTIFRGFQVKHTYRKLGEQVALQGLQTQMEIENLIARIVSEYNFYLEQISLYENLAYAVSLSRERVRIDEERYLLGSASKMQLLQSIVYLNADSSRFASQNEVLRSSQIRLNELMASENPGEEIILADSLIRLNENLIYDTLLMRTLLHNTGLQIASKNQDISELDYKIIESRAYP